LQNQGVLLYQILKEQKLALFPNLNVYSEHQPNIKISHSPLDPIMKGKYEDIAEANLKQPYISLSIIKGLETCKSKKYDLQKLVQICKEINYASSNNSYISIGVLIRAIIDHIPPIFSKNHFCPK